MIVSETASHDWDERVSTLGGGPFSTTRWVEACRDAECTPFYLTLPDGIAAGLLVRRDPTYLGRWSRQLFLHAGPVLGSMHPARLGSAIEAILCQAAERGCATAFVGSWDHPFVFEAPSMLRYLQNRDEYIVDLTVPVALRTTARQKVKQAAKSGVTCGENTDASLLPRLFELLKDTRDVRLSKGMRDYSPLYIPHLSTIAIAKCMTNGLGRHFVAEHQGRIVSSVFTLVNGQRSFVLLTGTDSQGYALRAPNALYAHVIETLQREGVASFNIGGVPADNPGLAVFKESFGAIPVPSLAGTSGLLRRTPLHAFACKLAREAALRPQPWG